MSDSDVTGSGPRGRGLELTHSPSTPRSSRGTHCCIECSPGAWRRFLRNGSIKAPRSLWSFLRHRPSRSTRTRAVKPFRNPGRCRPSGDAPCERLLRRARCALCVHRHDVMQRSCDSHSKQLGATRAKSRTKKQWLSHRSVQAIGVHAVRSIGSPSVPLSSAQFSPAKVPHALPESAR